MYRIHCAEVWGGIGNRNEDVCSSSIAASLYSNAADGEEGGDIYYLSVCDSDMLTRVAIADVVGHGEQVKDTSQWLYRILQAHMNDPDCGEILTTLNQSVARQGISALTTAAVIGFYVKDSNLYFAYAGHGPVLVRRKHSQQWRPLELDPALTTHPNGPLGVLTDTRFDQQRLALATGDRLFLHTDGLIEAANKEGVRFGDERLHEILDQAADKELPVLKQSVLTALADHTDGLSAQDDLTLLAVEIL